MKWLTQGPGAARLRQGLDTTYHLFPPTVGLSSLRGWIWDTCIESCVIDPYWEWRDLLGTVEGLAEARGWKALAHHHGNCDWCKSLPSWKQCKGLLAAFKSCPPWIQVLAPHLWGPENSAHWVLPFVEWGEGQRSKEALLFSGKCWLSASLHSLLNGRHSHWW